MAPQVEPKVLRDRLGVLPKEIDRIDPTRWEMMSQPVTPLPKFPRRPVPQIRSGLAQSAAA